MNETLKTVEEIRKINAPFPYTEPIKKWKEVDKRKVFGYFCTYIPEEIIHAAGILPVRITGDSEELALDEANALMHIYVCSFARSCLQLAREGKYDFLDGVVAANTCDPIRRLSSVWKFYMPMDFFYDLRVPRQYTPNALELYLHHIEKFKKQLEEYIGSKISDDSLRDSIRLYNRTRELLYKLYDLRRADNPPVSGAEVVEIMNAAVKMPKEEYNQLLERLLDEISKSKRALKGKFRVMINGSKLNNPEFIKTIEDLGGLVVMDELCVGARYFWDRVDTALPPVEALAKRYLNHFPCPRMFPCEERFKRVLNLISDYRIDGVITQMVRYCTPYTRDHVLLADRLKKEGVPNLSLDVEYGQGGTGPVKTRIQAFFEILEGKERSK